MKSNPILVAFCVVASLGLSGGCQKASKDEIPKAAEEARINSPSGLLDAVMVREDGGGAWTGFEWSVYIVAKGLQVDRRNSHEVFHASTLTGEKLAWSEPHLLEIHYDVANIESFRNLWGVSEIQNVGSTGEHDYLVEVRLVPKSQTFSLLTPDGGFKPKN